MADDGTGVDDGSGEEIPLAPSASAFNRLFAAFDYGKNATVGANLAKSLDTPTEAVLGGLREGIDNYAVLEARRANTEAQQLQNQEYVDSADQRELQRQANIDNLQAQAAQRRAQTAAAPGILSLQTLKEQNEQLKAQNEAAKLKRENDKLVTQQTGLEEARLYSGPSGDPTQTIEDRVSIFEKNLPKVINGGIEVAEDGPGGVKKTTLDPQVFTNTAGLYNDARVTNNPELITRAAKVARAVQNAFNQANTGAGKTIDVIPDDKLYRYSAEGQPAKDDLYYSGLDTATERPPSDTGTGLPGDFSRDMEKLGEEGFKKGNKIVDDAQTAAETDLVFPALGPTPQPERDKDTGVVNGYDLSNVESYIKNGRGLDEQKTAIVERMRAEGGKTEHQIDIDASKELATKQYKSDDNKYFTEATSTQGQAQQLATTAYGLLDRMNDLAAKNRGALDYQLGATSGLARGIGGYVASIGQDAEFGKLANDVHGGLAGLGKISALISVMEGGGKSKNIDSNQEMVAYSLLQTAPTNSVEQNVSALHGVIGKAEQVQHMQEIIDIGKGLHLPRSQIQALVSRYRTEHPAVVSGFIGGKAFPVRNPNMPSGFEFVAKARNLLGQLGRTEEGRALIGEPVDIGDVGKATGIVPSEDNPDTKQNDPNTIKGDPLDTLSSIADELNPFHVSNAYADVPDEVSAPQQALYTKEDANPSEIPLATEGSSPSRIPLASGTPIKVPLASSIPESLPDGASAPLVSRVVSTESNYNPNAESPTGAKGLMQLLDSTGKDIWNNVFHWPGEYDPFDKDKNLKMGTTYLNKMLNQFDGSTRLALAAYTVGPGTIQDAAEKASKYQGKNDWDTVKQYLPESKTVTSKGKEITIYPRKQATDYINKIMGTPKDLAKEKETIDSEKIDQAVATLPEEYQASAKENLTPEGAGMLNDIADATSIEEIQDTPIGRFGQLLRDANPLEATEAQAETLDSKKQVAPSPEDQAKAIIADDTLMNALPMGIGQGVKLARHAINVGPKVLAREAAAAWLGLTKGAFLSADDELTARIMTRSPSLGWNLDYDATLQKIRAIHEQMKEESPRAYGSGELIGTIGGYTSGMGLLKSAAKTIRYGPRLAAEALGFIKKAAQVAEPVAETATTMAKVAPTIAPGDTLGRIAKIAVEAGKGAVTGAKEGVKAGTVIGYNQGEDGVVNRLKSAGTSAVEGLVGGAAIGTAVGAVGEVAGQIADAVGIRKASKVTRAQIAQDELRVRTSEELEGFPIKEAQKQLDELRASTNPHTGVIDTVGEGKLRDKVAGASKQVETGNYALVKAKEALKDVPKRLEQTAEALTGRKTTSRQALKDLTQAIKEKEESILAQKKALDTSLYSDARAALPTQEVTKKTLTKVQGEVVEVKKVVGEVPVYKSKTVNSLISGPKADPDIAAANAAARNSIAGRPKGFTEPKNSFNVTQETVRELDSRATAAAKAGEGNKARLYDEKKKKLQEALYEENDAYRIADEAHAAAMNKIENFATKAITDIGKAIDEGAITNADKLVATVTGYDIPTIEALQKELGPKGKTALQDLFQAHISNKIANLPKDIKTGEAMLKPNAELTIPDFKKNNFPEFMDTVFGTEKTAAFQKAYETEANIVSTANDIRVTHSKTAKILQAGESTKAETMAADASNAVIAGGAALTTGSTGQSVGFVRSVWRIIKNSVTANPATKKEIDQEIIRGLYLDRKGSIEMIQSLIDESKDPKVKAAATSFIREYLIKPATRVAVQNRVSNSTIFKPETNAAREEIEREKAGKRRKSVPEIRITPNRG